jgi:hypothetical protein
MTAKATRDYGKDLAYGLAAQNDPRIGKALELLYPSHKLEPASKAHDRIGIDKWLIRPKIPDRVGVQIKSSRYPFSGDFAVELVADFDNGIPGWTLDPAAELLVQLYPNKVLLLHLPTLSYITRENRLKWQRTAREMTTQYASGRRVLSYFKYVPLDEIHRALLLNLSWPKHSRDR